MSIFSSNATRMKRSSPRTVGTGKESVGTGIFGKTAVDMPRAQDDPMIRVHATRGTVGQTLIGELPETLSGRNDVLPPGFEDHQVGSDRF